MTEHHGLVLVYRGPDRYAGVGQRDDLGVVTIGGAGASLDNRRHEGSVCIEGAVVDSGFGSPVETEPAAHRPTSLGSSRGDASGGFVVSTRFIRRLIIARQGAAGRGVPEGLVVVGRGCTVASTQRGSR